MSELTMHRNALPLYLTSLLALLTGCGIPLLVVPVPCVESGRTMEFRDQNKNPIKADGLLIVCRKRRWDVLGIIKSEPSNRVAEIRNGQAKLPSEWVPGALCLCPSMGWGYLLEGLSGEKPSTVIMLLPFALIPVPTFFPDEEVHLMPLIPGFRGICWGDRMGVNSLAFSTRSDESGGQFGLIESRTQLASALSYWEDTYERIRRPSESRRHGQGLDLRLLRESDYQRVRAFIEQELARIQAEIERADADGSEETDGDHTGSTLEPR